MQKVIIIGGPTACGKNEAALKIAERSRVEIVNADSRQVYRGLTIGTNQPGPAELQKAPHHLFGFLEPHLDFSAADFEGLATPVIQQIWDRMHTPVVVGGTGFYIRALLKGVWFVPKHDPELRSRLRKILAQGGKERLHRLLKRIDPESALLISPNDSYRVLRALEIYFQSGIRKSEIRHPGEDRFPAFKYFLDPDPNELRNRIEARTRRMFDSGWIEEVRGLIGAIPGFERMPAAKSLGYSEIFALLKGEMSLDECVTVTIRKTIQYAKRQRSWFRNQDQFIRITSTKELHKKLESVLQ